MPHTPLPWSVALPGERVAFPECHITGANGRPVSTTIYPLAPANWRSEDAANAEFIVRACNAYAELLAALQVMTLTPHINVYLRLQDPKALEQATNAIAKATGKEG